jgi:hypothetical protein
MIKVVSSSIFVQILFEADISSLSMTQPGLGVLVEVSVFGTIARDCVY